MRSFCSVRTSKYVSYKDIKLLMADLKNVYAAVDKPVSLTTPDDSAAKRGRKRHTISKFRFENQADLSTYFKFTQKVRRLICTANAIGRQPMYPTCEEAIK